MKQRVASGLALLTALFCLAGCAQWDIYVAPEPSYAYAEEYRDAWQYRQLDERLQIAYACVYETVANAVEVDGELTVKLARPLYSKGEATELYNAFTRDNPQFFCIGNTYRCEGVTRGENHYYDTLILSWTMTASEQADAEAALAQAVAELTRDLPNNNDIDAEIAVHDRLIKRCTYHQAAADAENGADLYPTAFTAYGALVEGKAVCEGYARGLQLLCNRVGIDGTVVTGTDENGAPHMWNVVELADKAYHVDATWDDSGDRLRHAYLNVSDTEISATHTLDDENPTLPICDSVTAGYYRYTGRYIDDYDRDVIATAMAQDVRRGADTIDLQFSPETYASARLFVAEFDEVAARIKARKETMWQYTYIADDDRKTISLYKIV